VILLGLCLPARERIPVVGASTADWNPRSFWAHPWGESGVHKGVDIFAREGTPVVTATPGLVVFAGKIQGGGNVVVILGPRWRLHYYAHLQRSRSRQGSLMGAGDVIGWVGSTGNAAGRPPHLHYSLSTLVPYPWRATFEKQGWKKMFYLDPSPMLAS
jgi:murein DD-endopeptidase MepM/ murein hydrolase activator NlpD